MRVLIIGGTGILSTDICQRAVEEGMEVYCINRGKHSAFQSDKVNVITANIRHSQEVASKIGNLTFDVVVDFLSYTPDQLRSSLSLFNHKCEQYIYISSATAYHKRSEDEVITEETPLGNQAWKYGQDKVKCEEIMRENFEQTGQKYTIIRPYVTYGKTRIPYAIIPNHQPWSWLNRIYTGKPIVLWDSGKAKCTLTNTLDFSIGVVGLFQNEKAYNEAFHITSEEPMTWKKALEETIAAIGVQPTVLDMNSSYIAKVLPEYRGVLFGDKGTNMVFNNQKIKSAVPEFSCKIPFHEGIQTTIDFLNQAEFMHEVDYKWDARLDHLISVYYRKNKIPFDRKLLRCVRSDRSVTGKEKIKYTICRYNILYYPFEYSWRFIKWTKNKLKRILGKQV